MIKCLIRRLTFTERTLWENSKKKYSQITTNNLYQAQLKIPNLTNQTIQRPIYSTKPLITDIYTGVAQDIVNRIHLINSISTSSHPIFSFNQDPQTSINHSNVNQLCGIMQGPSKSMSGIKYHSDNEACHNILNKFEELFSLGIIGLNNRVVNWSIKQKKILDESEVETRNEFAKSLYIWLKCKIGGKLADILGDAKDNLEIIGTVIEPWKYCGIKALSINEDAIYSIIENRGKKLIIASQKIGEFSALLNCKLTKQFSFKGNMLEDSYCIDPLFNRTLKMIPNARHVVQIGSGCNVISPSHDDTSCDLSYDYGIESENYISTMGYFCNLSNELNGLYYLRSGCESIVRMLKEFTFAHIKLETPSLFVKQTGEKVVMIGIPSWYMKIGRHMYEQSKSLAQKINVINDFNSPMHIKKSKITRENKTGSYSIPDELRTYCY